MSLQVELLEQSFNYIRPYGSLFISNFYENLFKTNPEIKSLFNDIDLETAKNKFWLDLIFIVDNLRRANILDNFLRGLGARLFTYGTLPKDYLLVEEPFFATFAQFLGSEWTVEFKNAWSDAYKFFRKLMLEGANQASQQMGLLDSVPNIKESQEEQVETFSSNVMTNPNSEVQTVIKEAVDKSPEANDYLEKSIENPISQVKNTLKEEPIIVTESNNSSLEDLELISISEIENNVVENIDNIVNTDNSLEEILDTPIIEIENIDTVTNTDNLLEEISESEILELNEVEVGDNSNSFLSEISMEMSGDLPKGESKEIVLDDNLVTEDLWMQSAPEIENDLEQEINLIGNVDDELEKILENPPIDLDGISTEKVESISSVKSSLTNDLEGIPIVESVEEVTQSEIEDVDNNDVLLEEILNTPIPELENVAEGELEILNSDEIYISDDLTSATIPQVEEISESKIKAIASAENSAEFIDKSPEEVLETPNFELNENIENKVKSFPEVVNVAEEQVTIKEEIKNSSEKNITEDTFEITMSESNPHIPEQEPTLEQSDKTNNSSEETSLETSLADLSEKLESKSVDPHFTQIFVPEPQSRTESELSSAATATATAVRPVASETKYQPQSQTNKSNKGLFIGGGVAGGVGLLLLLLL